MDDSTTTFSPLPSSRSSLGDTFRNLGSGGGRAAGAGRPSVGGLLQDENMSLALGGDDDDDDDAEADADPFQVAAGQERRRDDDGDDDPTVRLGSTAQRPMQGSVGSLAASTSSASSSRVVPSGPLASSILAGPGLGGSRSPSLASPRSGLFTAGAASTAPRPSASGSSSAPTTTATGGGATNSVRYEPDEDDLTDSALEARELAPDELARVRSLRDERDSLRSMNAVLEDLLGALKLSEGKLANFQATIDTSHQLLDTYAQIASQAEHTKDLLLDGEWQGVEKDYEFLAEREQAAREAEEAAQREAEERAAREEAEQVRKLQEEQWRREQAEMAATAGRGGRGGGPGTRGRGRGLRGSVSSGALRGSSRPPPTSTSTLPSRTGSSSLRGGSSSSASPNNTTLSSSGIPTRGPGISRGGIGRGRGTVRGGPSAARGRSSAV
ncbi:hypothetical protein JCM3774_001906 [Rhodotorula dairenensis]